MVNHSEHSSYASFPVFKSLDPNRRTALDRFLALFADVRGGEGHGALLLFANVFILMAAYYLLKTAREPLILTERGAATKTYLAAGQALLLLAIVPAYSFIASRLKRSRLLSGVSLFFAANLAIFYTLGVAGVKVGIAFYLWVGIFSVFTISQFWAFANDLYTEPQGKRLFPLIGVGSSIGAVLGAKAASKIIAVLGPFPQMLAAAALLLGCAALTVFADRRESTRVTGDRRLDTDKPLASGDGFALIFKDRYLVLIAALVLLLNVVNTSGEFLLSTFVSDQAKTVIGAAPELNAARQRFIGAFYGDYFFWVNTLTMLFQTLLVSRLFRYIGVGGALFVLPLIAFSGYSLLLMTPAIAVIKVLKILENSTDYSLQNTARHALFLPTSREAKYKAKAAIDTFFMRAGDVIQAGVVWAGLNLFALSTTGFAAVNLVLTLVWLGVVALLYVQYSRRSLVAQPA